MTILPLAQSKRAIPLVLVGKNSRWFIAVSLAVLSHVVVAFGFAQLSRSTAEGEGEFGIEIGIGFLGNAGLSNQNTDPSVELPDPPPDELEIEPEHEPESEPEPVPEPELPVYEPTPHFEQEVDTAVQALPDIELPKPNFQSREQLIAAVVDMVSREESRLQRSRSTGFGDTDMLGGISGDRATYIDRLFAKLNRYKHYPLAARRGPDEGTAVLNLLLRKDGYVIDAYVATSSGFSVLDAAAMRMVEMAKPLPPFPPEIESRTLRVRVPVKFEISDD